jgi:hypothetical protein
MELLSPHLTLTVAHQLQFEKVQTKWWRKSLVILSLAKTWYYDRTFFPYHTQVWGSATCYGTQQQSSKEEKSDKLYPAKNELTRPHGTTGKMSRCQVMRVKP